MKRSSRFIIFIASTFITFGSLVAFVGADHLKYHHQNCHYQNTDSTAIQNKMQAANSK